MRKLIKAIAAITGAALGYCLGIVVYMLVASTYSGSADVGSNTTVLDAAGKAVPIIFAVLTALVAFLVVPFLIDQWKMINRSIDRRIGRIPIMEVLGGVIGLLIGLFIAYLIGSVVSNIQVMYLGLALSILVYVLCGGFGLISGVKIAEILTETLNIPERNPYNGVQRRRPQVHRNNLAAPKIFDTSVIIDGRIMDIMKTGFIEGDIIIPEYVLTELRHLSDSADPMKKSKGRRGLAILKDIQQYYGIEIYNTYSDEDWRGVEEVDIKLLRLAQKLGGKVVTNDYNLIQVADIQEIPVLNINDVVKALKPVVIPGESMRVVVVREGRENNQGVGYMEDGTMIVVEGGRNLIGKDIDAEVTSILQTASGRMIFAKPKKN